MLLLLPLGGQDLTEGQQLLQDGRYHDAVKYYSTILKSYPGNTAVLNGLAEGQHRSGDPMTAIKNYKKSLSIDPQQPDTWISMGNIQYYHQQYPEGEFSYREAIRLEPENPRAYNNLASVLKEQQKLDQAILHFEKAFELDPQYALACRNLGDIYLRQGKSDFAVQWMKTAVGLDPDNMRGQYWLGKAFYLSGEFDNAKDQYLRILVGKPDLHSVHHDLGLAYFGMRNYGPALDHAKQAIRRNHAIYTYYLSLSRIYASLHNEIMAMAVLDSALNYDRSLAAVWIAKGDIHKTAERYEDALNDYKIASSYNLDDWKGYYKQGVVLYYLGRLDSAQSVLEAAAEKHPHQSGIHHFLGLVHLGKNDLAEAQLYLTIASEKDSVNGDIWFHLGQAYKHLKQFEQARASLENAIGIDSTHAEALYALGQIYTKLDQKEKSQKVLKKFRVVADFEKAEKKLKKQLSLKPSDNDIRRELALLYESRKDFLSAAEIWQQSYFLGDKGATAELERVKEKMK